MEGEGEDGSGGRADAAVRGLMRSKPVCDQKVAEALLEVARCQLACFDGRVDYRDKVSRFNRLRAGGGNFRGYHLS